MKNMKTGLGIVTAVALILVACTALAKRSPPPQVKPVTLGEVKYSVSYSTGAPRPAGGYVEASDAKTGKKLWELQIYAVQYKPNLERDVQDVFISSLAAKDGKLIVENERRARFEVDVERKTVKELPRK
jgi:hypothetical protein